MELSFKFYDQEQYERLDKPDIRFINLIKSAPFKSVEETFREVSYSYLNNFLIVLETRYRTENTAIIGQVINQKLEQYFPFIREENLEIEHSGDGSRLRRVSIKNLGMKTTFFTVFENVIFFLPLLPYRSVYFVFLSTFFLSFC